MPKTPARGATCQRVTGLSLAPTEEASSGLKPFHGAQQVTQEWNATKAAFARPSHWGQAKFSLLQN